MAEEKVTLGQAIDQIIDALNSLKPEARLTAVEAACSHLNVEIGSVRTDSPTTSASLSTQTAVPPTSAKQPPTVKDIRTLKEQKQPRSARQMACVVAYYLLELAPEAERTEIVTSKDLVKYFKQAKYRLPTKMSQILIDAKAGGYFDAAPGQGKYTLNAVGYNLVAHNLPAGKDK